MYDLLSDLSIKDYVEFGVGILALTISIAAYRYSKRANTSSIFLKRVEFWKENQESEDKFVGALKAHGISKEEIINSGFDIPQLQYYYNLIYSIWTHKTHSRISRIKNGFFLRRYKNIPFEDKVENAIKMDKKKEFFQKTSQTGIIFGTAEFQYAWRNYLSRFWTRGNKSVTAVLIEAYIANNAVEYVLPNKP